MVNFVVIYEKGVDLSSLDATEERIPIKNRDKIGLEVSKLEATKKGKEEELKKYIEHIGAIESKIVEYDNKLSYQIANANLLPEAEGTVLCITGWIPQKVLTVSKVFWIKRMLHT